MTPLDRLRDEEIKRQAREYIASGGFSHYDGHNRHAGVAKGKKLRKHREARRTVNARLRNWRDV
jgi:hypothetical protein